MSQEPARFLQFHTLTSYPATLLNRDDAGFAKRLPLGGAMRTRVSSQCLKRHWRTDDGQHSLAEVPGPDDTFLPLTVRSRRTFDYEIYRPLVEDGVDEAQAEAVTEALMNAVLQKSEARAKKEKDEEGEKTSLHTGQVLVFGRPEVDFFLKVAREALEEADSAKAVKKAIEQGFKKDGGKNLQAMLDTAGLDAALFGRMVTSDVLARCDAAVHVAHAFTVHAENAESDYFSAVDDLARESGETGSGHINSTELTSGLFYGYAVVDVPLLVSNLTGCRQSEWRSADRGLAGEVVRRFVHLMATVSPGAKLGSTAPYSHASLMAAEAGDEAPRTLANAFLRPVHAGGQLLENAYVALREHVQELDGVYGAPSRGRRALALGPKQELGTSLGELGTLRQLADWAAERIG